MEPTPETCIDIGLFGVFLCHGANSDFGSFKVVDPAADSEEISRRQGMVKAGTDRQESAFWQGWIP